MDIGMTALSGGDEAGHLPTENEAHFMWLADGCFVGMMDDMEQAILAYPVRIGWLVKSYDGVGGLLGLAKYRLTDAGRDALAVSDERR